MHIHISILFHFMLSFFVIFFYWRISFSILHFILLYINSYPSYKNRPRNGAKTVVFRFNCFVLNLFSSIFFKNILSLQFSIYWKYSLLFGLFWYILLFLHVYQKFYPLLFFIFFVFFHFFHNDAINVHDVLKKVRMVL